MNTSELEHRLVRVERRSRLLLVVGLGVGLLAGLGLGLAADKPPQRFGTVEASRFVVVDSKGKARAVLGLGYGAEADRVSLMTWYPNGEIGFHVNAKRGEEGVILFDPAGKLIGAIE